MEFVKGYYVTAEIRVTDESKIETAKRELYILQQASIKESGCSLFKVHQSNKDKSIFILWECFDDENAFKKHFENEHTKKYVNQKLTKVIQFYQTDLL